MSCSTPVPADHPLMIAWNAYKETEDFVNGKAWASKNDTYMDGALWSAFMVGFLQTHDATITTLRSELAAANQRIATLENEKRQTAFVHMDRIKEHEITNYDQGKQLETANQRIAELERELDALRAENARLVEALAEAERERPK